MTPGVLTQSALSVLLGTALGLGVCLLLSLVPRVSAPTLSRRIAPYVRDVIDPLGLGPVPTPGPVLRDAVETTLDRLARSLGASDAVGTRLAQAGWEMDAATFRARQLAWTVGGLGGGAVVVLVVALVRGFAPQSVVVAPVCAAVAFILCDAHLARAARTRARRVAEEMPTVLDFLALCLSAGEGVLDSLRRVGEIGSGELTVEIRRALVATGTGQPLPEALTDLGRRMQVPALARTLDHIVAALERGAPLAQVLQAQAADAREDAKRTLIEQAGRKEILMLLPVKR